MPIVHTWPVLILLCHLLYILLYIYMPQNYPSFLYTIHHLDLLFNVDDDSSKLNLDLFLSLSLCLYESNSMF